jgi:protein-S-isoprenylcysteine O-methyltransferase Ste14
VEDVALTCWSLFGLLALVLPVALQIRRTGSSGFKLPRGGPADRIAATGFVTALTLGVAAPLLARSGDVEPIDALDRAGMHVIGAVLFALGLVGVVATQQAMGRSWRIGVDPRERTGLVTGGPFQLVRNPIFAAMVITLIGLAAMVPSVVAIASIALLLVSLEVQTRLVEEPYLLRKHGDDYAAYARRVGRFVPGVGRLD